MGMFGNLNPTPGEIGVQVLTLPGVAPYLRKEFLPGVRWSEVITAVAEVFEHRSLTVTAPGISLTRDTTVWRAVLPQLTDFLLLKWFV